MTDLTPNLPEVVAEVSALFEAYEQALFDKNVDVLDATFWNSPHTIRYALHEKRLRLRRDPCPPRRAPARTGHQGKANPSGILTLGRDIATVNLEFKVRGAT